MQLQQRMMVAQLEDLMAKIQKSTADAAKAMASIDLIRAQAVGEKVSSAYAALQAGGVATSQPTIAPAGDEILRSAGWKDATPDPSIAQLNGPPVQEQKGTATKLNSGQTFAVEPRGNTNPASPPNPDAGVPQQEPAPGTPEPATGVVGLNEGIETQRIEP
jgi:hypothetical protein